MFRKLAALIFLPVFLLVLSACAAEQSNSPAEDTFSVSDVTTTQPDNTAAIYPQEPGSTNDAQSEDLNECVEKTDQLAEALKENTDALKACEAEKQQIAAARQNTTGNTADQRYAKVLSFYLEKAAFSEFPFPKCGAITAFSGEAWFANFKTALTAAGIPFGRETVTTADLTGGCASQEGKMAFFLGAENDILSEFHLVKYDFQSGKVEEAILADGSCGDTCPKQVGVRKGPYLTLSGGTSAYRYYYADNILKKE